METIRCLAADDVLSDRESALEARIAELKTRRKGHVSPFVHLPQAKQVVEKRRRQMRRFNLLRDGLLKEEIALRKRIVMADATIEAAERLLLGAKDMSTRSSASIRCRRTSPAASPRRVPPIRPARLLPAPVGVTRTRLLVCAAPCSSPCCPAP